jgi:hypothetical protein
MTSSNTPRFTALGKFVSVLLVVGLIGLGAYMLRGMFGGGSGGGAQEAADPGKSGGTPEVTTSFRSRSAYTPATPGSSPRTAASIRTRTRSSSRGTASR